MANENNISDESIVRMAYADTRFRLLQTVKFAGRSVADAVRLTSLGAQRAADELLEGGEAKPEQPSSVRRRRSRGKK